MFSAYLSSAAVLLTGLTLLTGAARAASDDPFGDDSPRPPAKAAQGAAARPAPRPPARSATRVLRPPVATRVAQQPDPALYRYRPQPSHAENDIEAALKEPTTIEIVEMPLKDVVDHLKDVHKLEIQLDAAGLKAAGVEDSTPITKNIKGVSLADGLNMILDETELGWEVRYDVLLITNPGKLAEHRTTRLYEVGDLVAVRDAHGQSRDDYDTLIKVITATVAPDSWNAKVIPASIKGATLGGAKVLSVSAPYAVHRELAEYLANLRRIAKGG